MGVPTAILLHWLTNSEFREKIMSKYLNIACGNTYVRDPDWRNIDYASDSEWVHRRNILESLGGPENTYEILYCSHFLEHIPFDLVGPFLRNCAQLMRPDSMFRIVVPDLEFMVKEYLRQLEAGDPLKADFCQVVLLDQCVRVRGGGRLADYINRICSGDLTQLRAYAEEILGPELFDSNSSSPEARIQSSKKSILRRAISNPALVSQRLEKIYINAVCGFLPNAFRTQNISFTSIGGKHQWIYDFQTLKLLLNSAGFTHIERVAFDSSTKNPEIFSPLDSFNNLPRKGIHQLFVEASVGVHGVPAPMPMLRT
jgi:hypothetical protein